ncbi:MAG: ribbon-helix-helix domain-containing protein [Burkholderiaceae bacterium]
MVPGKEAYSWNLPLANPTDKGKDMLTRWSIDVTPSTDRSVRLYLSSQGGASNEALSRFVEQAVRSRLFDLTTAQARAKKTDPE